MVVFLLSCLHLLSGLSDGLPESSDGRLPASPVEIHRRGHGVSGEGGGGREMEWVRGRRRRRER